MCRLGEDVRFWRGGDGVSLERRGWISDNTGEGSFIEGEERCGFFLFLEGEMDGGGLSICFCHWGWV